MTLRELRDMADAHIAKNPAVADFEVTSHIAGDTSIVGRVYYGVAVHGGDNESCFQLVAQPMNWRFGRPDSPAALRAAGTER